MGKRSERRFSVEMVGILLALLGIVVTFAGHLLQYGSLNWRQLFLDLYANAGSEMLSIAVTVLIIDSLYRRREAAAQRVHLIRQLSSKDNSAALQAADELRALGLLADGTLRHADLKYANLAGAVLSGADLQDAYLSFASLKGADLREANLRDAILRKADLREALLINADLSNAKLLEADLSGANLHGARLVGVNLSGADLSGARGLTDEVLAQAGALDGATRLPNGSYYDGRFD